MIASVHLSGSPGGGRQIKVAATATPGTTVHSTGVSASVFDELWLWASNTDTAAKKLTIEWGGTTSPDDLIEQTIPPEAGLYPIVQGLRLSGTGAAGRDVKAFCETANVVMVSGHVNRIS
jgi:hypothetical protein